MVCAELEDLRESADKLRCRTWANEPPATLEDTVVAISEVRAMLDAAEVEALAAYDAAKEWKASSARSAALRIAYLTNRPLEDVRWRVGLGRKLRTMPHTMSAFELGEISIDHVQHLARVNLKALAADFVRDEEMLVDKARRLRFDEFAAAVRRWRDVVDPEGTEKRALSNYEERRVDASQTFEGMGRLDGWLEPLTWHVFDTELARRYQQLLDAEWAEARERLGDAATVNDLQRTPGQRRHDALGLMAEASRERDGIPAQRSLGTTLVCDHATYLVALARILAALRGDDPDQYRYPFERRCEFADGTPVTPEQAVWASIAGWIAVLAVDDNGHPLNYSRDRRFFTGAQRDAEMIAFPTCDDPTCPIRSVHCQIDHILAWIDGGATDATNGKPRCDGHNLWKEHQRAKNGGITGRRRRRRTPP